MSKASQRAKQHKQNVKNGTQTFNDAGLSAQIAALQGQIKSATVPGADETALSTSLGNIQGASAVGQANAQDPTKNPVALGFQTGQAAAIDTQANAASVPLTERLALLQSNRKAALDAATAGLGFSQNQYDTESSAFNNQQIENARAKSAVDVAKVNAGSRDYVANVKAQPKPKKATGKKATTKKTTTKRSI